MGMMIFTMASGLTLVFGMMDVLNFGHGAFIALGAYVATLVLPAARELVGRRIRWRSISPCSLLALIAAAVVCGALGCVFERC